MTNLTATTAPQSRPRMRRLTGLIRRYPITSYLVVIFGVVWSGLGIPRLAGHSVAPDRLSLVLSALAFGVLFGGAVLVTAVADGRPGVRRFLKGLVHWRIGVGRWVVVVGALPALTVAVAGAAGTLQTPPEGWLRMGLTYLSTGVVGGALLINLWEEAAWAGFVQQRLMNRHRLLAGSVLTAVPFTLIHVPGTFQNTPAAVAAFNVAVVALVAPILRYLFGTMLIDTRGSILAVGVLHASFNAAGTLPAATGGWELIPAMLILTVAVAVHRRRHAATRIGR